MSLATAGFSFFTFLRGRHCHKFIGRGMQQSPFHRTQPPLQPKTARSDLIARRWKRSVRSRLFFLAFFLGFLSLFIRRLRGRHRRRADPTLNQLNKTLNSLILTIDHWFGLYPTVNQMKKCFMIKLKKKKTHLLFERPWKVHQLTDPDGKLYGVLSWSKTKY